MYIQIGFYTHQYKQNVHTYIHISILSYGLSCVCIHVHLNIGTLEKMLVPRKKLRFIHLSHNSSIFRFVIFLPCIQVCMCVHAYISNSLCLDTSCQFARLCSKSLQISLHCFILNMQYWRVIVQLYNLDCSVDYIIKTWK